MTPPQKTAAAPNSGASAAETASAGKGMPAMQPKPEASRAGEQRTAHDASVEASLSLPHERDQSKDMTSGQPAAKIVQAKNDLGQRREDTSKAPEMDRAYQKQK